MSKKRSVFAVFSVLISGLLLFAIWNNIHVYAQQKPPPQSRAADSLTPELKAKMCNPGNPSLKVVNATESRICGIPRTVKPHIASAATPPTSSAVSSSAPQQTTSTKPTSVTSVYPTSATTKQQQITNNNTNSISRTVPTTGATMAPVSNPTNRLSSSPSSSPSGIAPQVKAVNQPQQQHQKPITPINSTTAVNNATPGQNYTFTSTTPTSGKIMYLGYHGDKSNPSNRGSSSTDKSGSSPNLKPSNHSTTSTTAVDNGSTTRKSRNISTDNTNSDSSSTDVSTPTNRHHAKLSTAVDNGSTGKKNKNTDPNKIATTPTTNKEAASATKNKVDSIIKNSISGIIHKTPFLLPFH